jgi:uncharacterized membrane protein HdeD (DUF308 family)
MKKICSSVSILYRGLIAAGLGIFAVFVPGFSIITMIIIIGIAIGIAALISLWLRYKNPHPKEFLNILYYIGAIINLIFAVILIIIPSQFQEVFIILFGAVIIIAGIMQLINSLSVASLTNSAKIFLGISLLMIILGAAFMFDLFEKAEAKILFFGIILLIYGISNIVMSFWIKQHRKKLDEPESKIIEDVPYVPVNEEKENNEAVNKE